ncbi:hypothetical protein ACIBCN_19320 [Nocardia sp. NPDC051052]|uniref:hypothetical protein n=1 Tax=Nocardia sp. NPDC051052 TaxID=3364322 RepID=UPI0037923211
MSHAKTFLESSPAKQGGSIFVNQWGEFEHGCLCGSGDFYTVVLRDGQWIEIEPVENWDGWACNSCLRVFTDKGELITHASDVKWLEYAVGSSDRR